MKKRLAVSTAFLLAFVAVGVHADDMQKMHHDSNSMAKMANSQQMTVQGEIVDLGCYLGHGAKGKDHQSCALKCIANGMPMGLLTKDGTLYLLTESHDSADPFNQAKQWAAEQVTVTGPMLERDGMKALEVDQVKQVQEPQSAK